MDKDPDSSEALRTAPHLRHTTGQDSASKAVACQSDCQSPVAACGAERTTGDAEEEKEENKTGATLSDGVEQDPDSSEALQTAPHVQDATDQDSVFIVTCLADTCRAATSKVEEKK